MGGERARTFGVVFHCILKILNDPLLPDHLLYLSLLLDIERVFVQAADQLLPLEALTLLARDIITDKLGELRGVLQGGSKFGVRALKLLAGTGRSQDLKTDHLGVLLVYSSRTPPAGSSSRVGNAGGSLHIAYV